MKTVRENLIKRHVDFDLHRPIIDEENGIATFLLWLLCLDRLVVAVCDDDLVGKKLAKFGHVSIFTEDKDLVIVAMNLFLI